MFDLFHDPHAEEEAAAAAFDDWCHEQRQRAEEERRRRDWVLADWETVDDDVERTLSYPDDDEPDEVIYDIWDEPYARRYQ